MRIFVYLILMVTVLAFVSGHETTSNVVHVEAKNPWANGFWKKKMAWKPRWVKYWQERKYYVATWKKVWGPIEINEWIPLPKPPTGWSSNSKS